MEIKSAEFITSMAQYNAPSPLLPQIAVAGKSNVGKSSLINCLCRRKGIARTSGTPGKTRLINLFLLNNAFHLIDLPGYGFAKVDKQEKMRWGDMMDRYFSTSDTLCLTLHLVDIRHDPTEDDLQMNAFLRQNGFPFFVVATKADKLSASQRANALPRIGRLLQVQPWQMIAFSSENGFGRPELLAQIEKALTDFESEAEQ